MFTFDAMPVKFVGLLILFAYCTVWSLYELTRPQDGRQRVGNVLHLWMSVVMFLMVPTVLWKPFAATLGMPVIIATFAASTLFFLWRYLQTRVAHFAGHTMMFAAMTWHLCAMAVKRSHMGPGMDAWMKEASKPGQILWIVALIGVPFMAYLLIASLFDLRRVFAARQPATSCHCGENCTCGPDCTCEAAVPASEEVRDHVHTVTGGAQAEGAVKVAPATLAVSCHEERPVGTPAYRLTALADFAMNFGMFWMSTGLMVALLPFFKMLSF